MGKTAMGYRGTGSFDLMEKPLRFLHKQHEDILQADLFSALINGFRIPLPTSVFWAWVQGTLSQVGTRLSCLNLSNLIPCQGDVLEAP